MGLTRCGEKVTMIPILAASFGAGRAYAYIEVGGLCFRDSCR